MTAPHTPAAADDAPGAGAGDARIGDAYLAVQNLIDAVAWRTISGSDGTIARARDARARLLDIIDALAGEPR